MNKTYLTKDYNDCRLEFKMSMLSKKIKHLRKERGYTQKSLAFIVGTSQSLINNIENKRNYNPTLLILIRIAEAFNVTVSELLSNTKS
jgi:transcriptional regulator with XRE-family HTH domain